MTRLLPGSAWHDARRDGISPPSCRAAVRRAGPADRARGAGLRRSAARRGAVTGRAVRRLFDRVGLVQIDSVNVLSRAHYLPLFSRAGPYDRALLDRAAHYAPRRLFEYWGHEASLIPVGLQPRAALADGARGGRRLGRHAPDPARPAGAGRARCSRRCARPGPVAASEVIEHERPKRTGPWWDWSDVKRAFEWLFWSGQVTSARRRGFERLYDLPERVLPRRGARGADAAGRGGAARAPARRGALARRRRRSATCATTSGCPPRRRSSRVAELVEAGELWPVEVEGWRQPGLRRPRRALPAAGRRARARRAVRLADLGAAARRARVRLPLPDRDLRARAEARARLLRAPVPARRPARGARRPEGRSPEQRAARPGRARRAGRAAGDGRGAARAARGDGRLAGARADRRRRRAATSRRRSPAPPASSRCARPPSPRARRGSRRRRSRAAG